MATIKEKAQAYDGLIERLKDLKFAYRFSPLSDTIEEKFPELKDGEDEKIRKGLLYVIKHHPTLPTEETEEYIAWLEKQSEQKSTWTKEDEHEVAVLEAYIRSNDWSEQHIERALGIVDELVNKVKSIKTKM